MQIIQTSVPKSLVVLAPVLGGEVRIPLPHIVAKLSQLLGVRPRLIVSVAVCALSLGVKPKVLPSHPEIGEPGRCLNGDDPQIVDDCRGAAQFPDAVAVATQWGGTAVAPRQRGRMPAESMMTTAHAARSVRAQSGDADQ